MPAPAPDYAYSYLPTPIGQLELRGSEAGLAAVTFLDEAQSQPNTAAAAVPACLREAHQQLQAYFGRELRDFSLVYDVARGTEFQQRVWQVLQQVGYGRTASYLDLARLLNNPGAVRAVGAANGQNPLAIVWPCHRIIGAGGQLTGYAGGLPRKKWLLAHEQPAAQTSLFG
ncbi:methylated-DNA--[protein]-cysteine S-methyltransferase [Hymenobacter chitinivorans]|uniref:Methylated-DNA--protein-cysteine methyltransferase n=1 Tax=Hymenobacter chitinivorans DSM 11115 TaxID=1121954 RepID=A0A2M9B572_9BACT|nr:methylated-DNA--[protein]-cysteine S-methyltransferase [Hymenobacter chitinivorans]PJJ53065.1 methylated-DNA-[protein]-cysteine S-methyltransferase [Hymenobacter chitinivorans DSM 11115]